MPRVSAIDLLRCPISGHTLEQQDAYLVTPDGKHRYTVNGDGIPLFAEQFSSADAKAQQQHYDSIADAYVTNLAYPHTQEYLTFLDRVLLDVIHPSSLGTVAEICCGRGEAFQLLGKRIGRGVGVDISVSMLKAARAEHKTERHCLVQGDATRLPLADAGFDSVFMLGGIHHVNDRDALFAEIARILKPGGRFYFREPVSDFFMWRWIRAVVYRLSPILDNTTERPLLHEETVPVLERCALRCESWSTHGFLGFCLFMNSDVLVFNRLFRFVPGIRSITRLASRLDQWTLGLPGLSRAGLQVVGVAVKPDVIADQGAPAREPGSSHRE
jgi:ubiquinone/menaquinone biosynthesis C-methylase UbiE